MIPGSQNANREMLQISIIEHRRSTGEMNPEDVQAQEVLKVWRKKARNIIVVFYVSLLVQVLVLIFVLYLLWYRQ